MRKKYPYWLYERVFDRALEFDQVEENDRMSKSEWNKLVATQQDHTMTSMEEDVLRAKSEEEEEED